MGLYERSRSRKRVSFGQGIKVQEIERKLPVTRPALRALSQEIRELKRKDPRMFRKAVDTRGTVHMNKFFKGKGLRRLRLPMLSEDARETAEELLAYTDEKPEEPARPQAWTNAERFEANQLSLKRDDESESTSESEMSLKVG